MGEEHSRVRLSQARPLKMEGPVEQTVQTVRGSAHVDWQKDRAAVLAQVAS